MAQQFLTSINLNSNELQNALLHPLATAPVVGPAGKVYYNTSEDVLYVSDGTAWRSISGDITSILAGNGVSVSGSTGDVTVSVNAEASQFEFVSGALTISNGAIGSDELDSTGVVAGSYGSATTIPTFTVDEDGRLTAAGFESISTTLEFSVGGPTNDTVLLGTDVLSFLGGDGIDTSLTGSTGVNIAVDSTVVRTSGDQTIAGNKTFSNDVVVSGNLTVSGSTTTVNTETILLADNLITLNSNFTGPVPTQDAGIEVERGDENNVELIWNETTDKWQIEVDPVNNVYQNIATEESITSREFVATVGTSPAVVTHNLGSTDVMVQLFDTTSLETVFADVVRATNTVTVTWNTSNTLRVLIKKIG